MSEIPGSLIMDVRIYITVKDLKQVAQRATIAHLTTSHQNTLNSSQVKDLKIF